LLLCAVSSDCEGSGKDICACSNDAPLSVCLSPLAFEVPIEIPFVYEPFLVE
jgi:hypothetical protein